MVSLAWQYERDGESLVTSATRWLGAAVTVAAMQAGIAYAVLNWPRAAESAGEPAGAIMIDIAPVVSAPDVPPQELAVGPEQAASEESIANISDDVVEELLEMEDMPVARPKPIEDIPKLAELQHAEAVLPQPIEDKPLPKEEEPEVEKLVEQKKAKKPPRKQSVASQAMAPRAVKNAKKSRTNAAPRAGTSSSMSAATWRGRLVAHLNRHKRHPGGGARGTASISFTINRSGSVTGVRLTRSSGNAALDQAAVALARRASPVPAPPSNVGGGSVTVNVPIRFTR
ncbi:cell envelope biogenesis protein TonB [Hyphomicrobium nitrativorans NL23]|uniref:Cell envelope biogenesis protein TonB n=1 Tax=Hyphomicrobium nitrativorans NL23 TaxID=1029756 RepID=V5SAP1_9HYPH|nr:energy transducer TonB [Hyphomicrobium nitrativorans]AHB47806.1 cell envelope biogenesis protein TonB [Hyphomicrobium nitrativorans NL23]